MCSIFSVIARYCYMDRRKENDDDDDDDDDEYEDDDDDDDDDDDENEDIDEYEDVDEEYENVGDEEYSLVMIMDDDRMSPLDHCPTSPTDSQTSCDQIPVGDIIGGNDVVVNNNGNNNLKRKASPLNHEDTDGDALSPRKQMHHGNNTNNNDVSFVLIDDDGGGPGDDLGSEDVVDPDDVQDLTEFINLIPTTISTKTIIAPVLHRSIFQWQVSKKYLKRRGKVVWEILKQAARQALEDKELSSSSSQWICCPGHKDDIPFPPGSSLQPARQYLRGDFNAGIGTKPGDFNASIET
ncbi:hypothetical protein C0J52_08622 [Blattella germanica]|nr:hypothetical protein C0J52_08622 [Blattella germanica]